MPTIEQRVRKLREELNRHNRLYYIDAKPEISDQEYDKLMHELIELETQHPEMRTPDSPSQRVGGEPIEGFRTVEHAVPMMSIDNTYDEAEVRAFDQRVRKSLDLSDAGGALFGGQGGVRYVLEPKVDGVAASLRYEDGVLVLGATRGDGRRGDDITHNIRTIKMIPLRLHADGEMPRVLEVRGEVYMPSSEFQRINAQRQAAGQPLFANPRNSTAGTLKQLDPRIAASRRLRFVSHGVGQFEPESVNSYWELLKLLKRWGLPVAEHTTVADHIDDVVRAIEQFAKVRGKLAYQTDGMVIKVDSFAQRKALKETSKAPRWVIAYKYPAEQMQTKLNAVTWQVGKGGNLTPVAELEAVFIAGSTVRRATLHNIDQIQRLGIHIPDVVVIEKAGEVIPYVVQAVPEKRPRDAKPVSPPRVCPSCAAPVEREADTPYIRCNNPECPAQLLERLVWFAGRNQMNIEGLGPEIVEQLVRRGVIRTYADLYRLHTGQIAELTRETQIGQKSAQKIVEAIAQATLNDQRLPIAASKAEPSQLKEQILNQEIPNLGEKTVEQLVEEGLVESVADLRKVTVEQIAALPREIKVGIKTAEKVVSEIEKSKSRGLGTVLASLNIRHVGSTIARDIAGQASDIDTLISASELDIRKLLEKDVEEEDRKDRAAAQWLHDALRSSEGKRLLSEGGDIGVAEFLEAHGKPLGLNKAFPPRKGEKGQSRIHRLAKGFEDLASLLRASSDEIFERIKKGGIVARSLHRFLQSAHGRHVIQSLQAVGVQLSEQRAAPAVKDSAVRGKTVVITGTFEDIDRSELTRRLESLGAKVTGSVSAKTDLVLCGQNPGTKLAKARELGVEVWEESQIRQNLTLLLAADAQHRKGNANERDE